LLYIRWITRPVQALRDWARTLDSRSIGDSTPSFKYRELDGLANIIHQSMKSVQESVEREQQFLSHASHELRTPIAVTRTNSELLSKVMQKEGASERQQAILARISRANKTMTDLTDTLLWLSRESENSPTCQKVELAEMTEELTAEVAYLLQGKPVKVTLSTARSEVSVAVIPCRIALLNLIRNAYQHTLEGEISITLKGGQVMITNSVSDAGGESEDLGFGLGLKLTKKIADVYGWSYSGCRTEQGYRATLTFPLL
jgi:signal transduction histidine kinase